MRRALAVLSLAATLLAACGEPPVELEIPAREDGQRVLDPARILDEDVAAAAQRVTDATGLDTVALAFTSEEAGRGEATRGARALVAAWDVDLVLVAVARPDDFSSTVTARGPDQRQRFLGLEPADTYEVPGGLREEVIGEVTPLAEENRWPEAFVAALDRLASELPDAGEDG